ncbi:2380_t:CDS:1 [Racocetra fulgida]|uniref:2380_t:CDS:1 n=1 Tax=Racocetra fulgida TaxID=60492 RepID=A0A9N9HH42_9GLOM|nr:2380_t:CDS:1 [Racocetra fulgida]
MSNKSAQEYINQKYPINGTCNRKADPENKGKRREEITKLDISKGKTGNENLFNKEHKNLFGDLKLEGFTNLRIFKISSHQLISLDVSACRNLEELDCCENELTKLNINGCTKLKIINCTNNSGLTEININNCPSLDRKQSKTDLTCKLVVRDQLVVKRLPKQKSSQNFKQERNAYGKQERNANGNQERNANGKQERNANGNQERNANGKQERNVNGNQERNVNGNRERNANGKQERNANGNRERNANGYQERNANGYQERNTNKGIEKELYAKWDYLNQLQFKLSLKLTDNLGKILTKYFLKSHRMILEERDVKGYFNKNLTDLRNGLGSDTQGHKILDQILSVQKEIIDLENELGSTTTSQVGSLPPPPPYNYAIQIEVSGNNYNALEVSENIYNAL